MEDINIGKQRRNTTKTARDSNSERLSGTRHGPPKYLIPEEKTALFRVIKKVRDVAIFRLAMHHGLRASELGIIQMRDYYPGRYASEDRLYIERLKGSISGPVWLVPAAAHAIRLWVKKRGQAPGPMFLSQKRSPISRRRLDELMKYYCKLIDLPPEKAHFHTLKHTCGTELLSEFELPIVQVQAHLGHADIRSTMIYAQLTAGANAERAKKLRNWR
jgi:integrase